MSLSIHPGWGWAWSSVAQGWSYQVSWAQSRTVWGNNVRADGFYVDCIVLLVFVYPCLSLTETLDCYYLADGHVSKHTYSLPQRTSDNIKIRTPPEFSKWINEFVRVTYRTKKLPTKDSWVNKTSQMLWKLEDATCRGFSLLLCGASWPNTLYQVHVLGPSLSDLGCFYLLCTSY